MRISKFRKIISNKRVVSFDIFDTLIERKCLLPTDVFFLAAYKLYSDFNSAADFCCQRIKAEQIVRGDNNEEVTLDDIYNIIGKVNSDADKLKALELETELEVCCPKESGIDLFKEAIQNGKTVILATDMYLPLDFIKTLLDNNGISCHENIFLSCVHKKSKKTGLLFNVALNTLSISASDIVHFGDSIAADFKGAQKANIEPHLLPRKRPLLRALFNKLGTHLSLKLRYKL